MRQVQRRAWQATCCNAATERHVVDIELQELLTMNAPLNNSQVKLLMAESLSYRAPMVDSPAPPQFGGLIGRIAARIAAAWHRRAVMDELSSLSDRDLADIGINRGDLGRIFDPRFNRDRYHA